MSPLIIFAIALAGGLGAGLRYTSDAFITPKVSGDYPWATSIINISGSCVLGLITGLGTAVLSSDWILILGTGLLGGFTTFSTASFETVRLIQRKELFKGLLHGFGGLTACVLAAIAGLLVGAN